MATVLNTILGRSRRRRPARGKKGKQTRRVSRKRQSSRSENMSNDGVDVRTPRDISKLTDLIKKNKVVIVLVYADWCGHCHTFKQDIWSKLNGMTNRKVPLAAINEKVYKEGPLSNVKVDGYPTVMAIGNDMRPAIFKDEAGNSTTSMPNTRDISLMESIVTKDPEEVMNTSSGASGAAPAEEVEGASPILSARAEEALNNAGEEAVNNLSSNGLGIETRPREEGSALISNPPDAEDDLMASQVVREPTLRMNSGKRLNSAGSTLEESGAAGQIGGSLYGSLLEASRLLVIPAAFAGSAIYLDKRAKSRAARRRRGTRATAKKLRAARRH